MSIDNGLLVSRTSLPVQLIVHLVPFPAREPICFERVGCGHEYTSMVLDSGPN